MAKGGGREGESERERGRKRKRSFFLNQPSSDPKARSADDLQLNPLYESSLTGRAAGASADSMDVPQEANRRN